MKEKHGTHGRVHTPLRRAHFSFWILVTLATLMAGALSMSLAAAPSLLTSVGFALSAATLAASLALAARVMLVLARRERINLRLRRNE